MTWKDFFLTLKKAKQIWMKINVISFIFCDLHEFFVYFAFNSPWTIKMAHEFLGHFSFWFSCRYRGRFAFLFLLIF